MCLARPVRVLKCEDDWVEVEGETAHEGGDGHTHRHTHRAWSALVGNKDVAVGDYLLVHGELAIHKLPEDEALRIIDLINEIGID